MFFVSAFAAENDPKHSAEVLWSVPKRKKAVMCLMEKIWVLDTFCSSMSYSAAGPEFHANESTVWNIQKKEEDICWLLQKADLQSGKLTSVVQDEAVEKMGKWLNLWIPEMMTQRKHYCEADSQRNVSSCHPESGRC